MHGSAFDKNRESPYCCTDLRRSALWVTGGCTMSTKTMKQYVIDAFTDHVFAGNLAAVYAESLLHLPE